MAIIKVDSKFFGALADYLDALSNNRVTQAEALHAKFEATDNRIEKIKLNHDAAMVLGEANGFNRSAREVRVLLNELIEKFTVEEGS